MIPQHELDRLTLVINQAEFVTQEGYPELGHSVLQQGYQRVRASGVTRELDTLWKRAIADHRERFPFVDAQPVSTKARDLTAQA